MKLRRWMAAALLLLLLAGCSTPTGTDTETGAAALPSLSGPKETASAETETGQSASTAASAEPTAPKETAPTGTAPAGTDPTAPPETEQEPAVTESPVTQAPETAPPVTEPPPDRPAVLSMGYYQGPYPEDGSDEAVDSVAVILVENRSEIQLQFAELHYRIDGREALFRVSELPPGAKAMVLENDRLIATPASVWEALPEEDLSVYLAAEPEERLELRCDADGKLRVTNRGTETAAFDLIYKQKNDEGVFVGGIAYHLRIEALAPGETRILEAPHYSAARSVPVRVTAKSVP